MKNTTDFQFQMKIFKTMNESKIKCPTILSNKNSDCRIPNPKYEYNYLFLL